MFNTFTANESDYDKIEVLLANTNDAFLLSESTTFESNEATSIIQNYTYLIFEFNNTEILKLKHKLQLSNLTHVKFKDDGNLTSIQYMRSETSSQSSKNNGGFYDGNNAGFFENHNNLLRVDFSEFGSNVELLDQHPQSYGATAFGMDRLFFNCNALESILFHPKFGENITTIKGTIYAVGSVQYQTEFGGMNRMFANCSSLKSLNLPNFGKNLSTIQASGMYKMCEGCTNLEYVNMASFNPKTIELFYAVKDMFKGCTSLTVLHFYNFGENTQFEYDTTAGTTTLDLFANTSSDLQVVLSHAWYIDNTATLTNSNNITYTLSLPSGVFTYEPTPTPFTATPTMTLTPLMPSVTPTPTPTPTPISTLIISYTETSGFFVDNINVGNGASIDISIDIQQLKFDIPSNITLFAFTRNQRLTNSTVFSISQAIQKVEVYNSETMIAQLYFKYNYKFKEALVYNEPQGFSHISPYISKLKIAEDAPDVIYYFNASAPGYGDMLSIK